MAYNSAPVSFFGAGFWSVFFSGSACARTTLRHTQANAKTPASTTRRLFMSIERIIVLLLFVTCHNSQPVPDNSIHIICFFICSCYGKGAPVGATPK
jgi:uncharacterized membrane protein